MCVCVCVCMFERHKVCKETLGKFNFSGMEDMDFIKKRVCSKKDLIILVGFMWGSEMTPGSISFHLISLHCIYFILHPDRQTP